MAHPLSVRARLALFAMAVAVLGAGACAQTMRNTATPEEHPSLRALWVNPEDVARRDLFRGPAGPVFPNTAVFQFVKKDLSGASPGYDVHDANGVEWSVKMGVEVQPEIVVSRLLWGMGFRQPPTYYAPRWTLAGGAPEEVGTKEYARFRPDLADWKVVDEWSWFENPFVGTRPLGGLIAANLLLNNWDFKTSNNKVYERKSPGPEPSRWYVVRDLGASLGKTSQPEMLSAPGFIRVLQGSKGNIDDFEAQSFVKLGKDGRPDFDYEGNYNDLVRNVTVQDVVWMCRLMSQLSDRQISDAFRAAAYDDAVTRRYVVKIRSKVAEGLALAR